METTIVKVGNSLGSRFSRAYLQKMGLKEGDRVQIIIRKTAPDKRKALSALRTVATMNGPLARLDVAAWQDNRRQQQNRKDGELRDILGR